MLGDLQERQWTSKEDTCEDVAGDDGIEVDALLGVGLGSHSHQVLHARLALHLHAARSNFILDEVQVQRLLSQQRSGADKQAPLK